MPDIIDAKYRDLLKCSGTIADPVDSYVRIAKVLQTSLFTREMTIQFVDGDRDIDTDEFLEGPETAICVVGSDDPTTTYAPSCTVYGRGDLCAAIILRNGEIMCASLMDLYEDVNRENFALIKGWALYDVLGGLMIDFNDDTTNPENSYIDFWNIWEPNPYYIVTNVTRIQGDPTKRHVFRRILDYFTKVQTQQMNVTSTSDPAWEWSVDKAGPDNNPMRRIHGRMHKGKYVCGFPYVEDLYFTNDAATLANDIVAYHPTLTGLMEAEIHPLQNGDVLDRYFLQSPTVVCFNDENPTHVLLIGAFPAWSVCDTIYFIEIPVYSMSGRKFLERPIIDEGLETEHKGDIDKSWQFYAEHIRVVDSIDRTTYVDFLAHESDIEFTERVVKSPVAYLHTQTGEIRDFCILDGYGWGQSGTVFDVNKVKRIEGTIERTPKPLESDGSLIPYANGSVYDYVITRNNPASTGSLDLSYSIRFQFEKTGNNVGDIWERQNPNNSAKEYQCFNDGENTMERTCDFDYYCIGWYDDSDPITGRIGWSDGGGMPWDSNVQTIVNKSWHHTYRNGGHVWTDYYYLNKTGFNYSGGETKYVLMYADVEFDLFVMLKIETHIDPHDGIGPGWTFIEALGTHWQRHTAIVIYEGVEWTIWTYFIPLTKFPTIYNFFPWLSDVGRPWHPGYPDSPIPEPNYSIDTNHTCYYFHEPQFYPWNGTLKTGYTTGGLGFPGPVYGPSSMPTWQILLSHDTPASWALPDDLLQVSIDYETRSFCVIFESFYQTDTPNGKILTYPNGGNALYAFDGGTPHFNKPAVDSIIDLSL